MDKTGRRPPPLLGFALALVLLSGCADGPWMHLTSMNPWIRKQWVEDEQYGPTFHRKLAELKALREQAGRLTPQQQREAAQEVAPLVEAESNPVVRVAMVRTLAALDGPTAEGGLRLALTDTDPLVRIAACQAWGQRGGSQALELLAGVVGSDTDQDVRMAATRQLARFQDTMAFQALALALDDPDPALQYRAVQSLKTASGRDYGDNLTAWRQFAQGQDPGPQPPVSLVEQLRRWLF